MIEFTYTRTITEQSFAPDATPIFNEKMIGVTTSHVAYAQNLNFARNLISSWGRVKPYVYVMLKWRFIDERDIPLGSWVHCHGSMSYCKTR